MLGLWKEAEEPSENIRRGFSISDSLIPQTLMPPSVTPPSLILTLTISSFPSMTPSYLISRLWLNHFWHFISAFTVSAYDSTWDASISDSPITDSLSLSSLHFKILWLLHLWLHQIVWADHFHLPERKSWFTVFSSESQRSENKACRPSRQTFYRLCRTQKTELLQGYYHSIIYCDLLYFTLKNKTIKMFQSVCSLSYYGFSKVF